MGILNQNEIGVVRKKVREYYDCGLKPMPSRIAHSIVWGICNMEYAIERMPSIPELYKHITGTLNANGYDTELIHSNITFIEIYWQGERAGTTYITELIQNKNHNVHPE